jgi:glycosyltransferase involved in cell wall biosynthesis
VEEAGVGMRIGFVCCEYPPMPHGGIGSSTHTLASSLAARGHFVWVGGVYSRPVQNEKETDHGVEVVRFGYPRGPFSWVAGRYQLFSKIRRLMEEHQLDIIETPDWEGFAAGWPRLPGPVVVRLHGSLTYFAQEMSRPIERKYRWIESSSFRRCDYWCSTSRYTAEKTETLFGAHPQPPAVLFNPVEVPANGDTAERDRHRVVFAGTLTPKKGIISLVKAWPAVVREHPQAELHIYGRDEGTDSGQPMREYLCSQIDAQVQATIRWHGQVDRQQVRSAFRTCRLAIFPSYSEAFSMVPLEAMADRCPVIYTRRSSGPELITEGVDGLLIDPDDHRGISQAVCRLLEDDELASRLSQAGYDRVVSGFSTNVLIPRNEAFYAHCIEDFRRKKVA